MTLAFLEEEGELQASSIQLETTIENDAYVLDGEKILTPHADIADALIVPVRTSGTNSEHGISLLIVDADQIGLEKTKQNSMDATRSMFRVSFDNVRVPKENLLGSENEGWHALQTGLFHLNAAWCSIMTGGMDHVVDMAIDYGNTREQFGQPIGRFQAIKHKIVDMKLDLESARSLSYYASWALEHNSRDMEEVVALARSFITDAYIEAASDNIQIHGGMGFTWEFDCHLLLKRARSLENNMGSPDEYREEAAMELGWLGTDTSYAGI